MNQKSVLIMAGGDEVRWHMSGGTGTKLLIPVATGELLLCRTVRLVYAAGIMPTIIAWHSEIKELYPAAFMPEHHRWTVESVYDLRPHWGENWTAILLGDVLYSEALLETIFRCEMGLTVYGNAEEIFAVTFSHHAADKWALALKAAVAYAETATREKICGKLWTAYRAYIDAPIAEHDFGRGYVFAHLPKNDPTCDFDRLSEYEAYKERQGAMKP